MEGNRRYWKKQRLSVKKVIPLTGSDLFVCRIADITVPEEYIQNGVYSLTEMNPVLVSQKEYLKVKTKEECGQIIDRGRASVYIKQVLIPEDGEEYEFKLH